ncbi:Trypsin-1, partial [Folsomia candida]
IISGLPRTSRRVPGGGRIIGGEDAVEGQFPYQLTLMRYGSHVCGASIIDQSIAVTAAHCVYGESPSNLSVIAGKLHRLTTGSHEQTRNIERITIHESFDDYTFANGIALLHLEVARPFIFDDFVSPIPLPIQGQETTGPITASGWGVTVQGGSQFANILQFVQLPVINDTTCQAMYPEEILEESMLCAGFPEGGRDACLGDSGGPLVYLQGGYLAGLVSWGYGCALPGRPGVNTEVAYFVDWILSNSRQT